MFTSRLRFLCAVALAAATASGAPVAVAEEPAWIHQFGTHTVDGAFAVAAGPGGRVHVAGYTYGWMYGAKGRGDAFVITYDADGQEMWRRQPGTSENDYAWGVAAGTDGSVYVVGETYGSLSRPNKGESDAFAIKFDRDGRYVWKHQSGSAGYQRFRSAAADANGNLYVGEKTEQPNLGSFLIKIGPDGRIVWKRPAAARGIATDRDGNVYAVGAVTRKFQDASVIKFDGDGTILWKRQPSTPRNDEAEGVATDADGNAYVVGYSEGSLGGTNQGFRDGFVIKFDPDGHYLWKRQVGMKDSDVLHGDATGADGTVYAAGETKNYPLGGPAHGSYDAFLIKYPVGGPQ